MVVTDYNEQFLDKRGTVHLIDELKAYIDGISTGDMDLSGYVTKEELQAKLDALDINIDLSAYATKEEIPSLEGYATTEYVDTAIANVPSGGGGTTDLPNYYTKEEVYTKEETDALIPTVTNGTDGIDGISPTATVTKEGSVATITCTDVNGTTTETISDGANGTSSGGSSGGMSDVYSTDEIAIGT